MSDAQTAAAIHKACFDRGWSQSDIETHIQKDIALGLFHGTQMAGFILLRCVAEQAEVLTLAVVTARRRQGAGPCINAARRSSFLRLPRIIPPPWLYTGGRVIRPLGDALLIIVGKADV